MTKENLEAMFKRDSYNFLGWMNDWVIVIKKDVRQFKNQPKLNACRQKAHILKEFSVHRSGVENIIYCEKCKIYYKVDSSD